MNANAAGRSGYAGRSACSARKGATATAQTPLPRKPLLGRPKSKKAAEWDRCDHAGPLDESADLRDLGELVRRPGSGAASYVMRVVPVSENSAKDVSGRQRIRSSRGRLKTTFSCCPTRSTGATPPHSRIFATTRSTSTSGADAPAVTPTTACPRTTRAAGPQDRR